MKLLLTLSIITVLFLQTYAQGTDYDYERIKIGDARHIVCGLSLSPDKSTLAISSIQGYPFYLFDWKNKAVLKEFNVGNWYAGSSIDYSVGGKYVLLNQLYYIDFAPNKDREVNFEIVDAKTGERVLRFEEYHSVAIAPDEKFAVALTSDAVSFWNLSTKSKETSFNVKDASNSVAISPDGKLIAVSHHLYEKDAENIPQLQRDKKTLKSALKYKQQISIYDVSTFKKLYTVNELYDIVYKLKFSDDGKNLFCLNIPHAKQQNTAERQSYINIIDMETGSAKRRGFTSKANYEPDFKLSHDGRWFGVVSRSNQFLELHIYDFETGKMAYRFQQSYRLFEKNDGEMFSVDSRISFVFLPDNESVLMTMGNHLILWKYDKK